MFDIIIIGGGVSGLYAALKLNKNKKVLLLEKEQHFGGRIYTDYFSLNSKKYSLEAGAARILETHNLMIQLIKKMNLYSKLVKIDARVNFIPSKYYTLTKYANKTGFDYIDEILKQKNESNEYLRQITFEQLLLKHYSDDKVKFILDSCGYYGDLKIQNAYDALKVFKYSVRTDKHYYIMKNGFSQLINEMISVIKLKHMCLLNQYCKNIYYNDGVFTLNINNKKFLCQNIILAIPKENLLNLGYLKPYFPLLNSIYCIPLLRIYSIYKKEDVWFHGLKKITTNNKLKYVIPINPEKGIIMTSYTDHTNVNYWQQKCKNKKELDFALKKNIENVFRIKAKTPLDIKCYHWPCGVGLWKPGYNSNEVITNVLHPNKKIPMFIVGENYSKYQGWMEGALDSVERCLQLL